MMEEKLNNNSSAKAFGGVVAILAVIAGIFAMTEPMGQRIDFLSVRLDQLHEEIKDHAAITGHVGAMTRHGKHEERFKEVETQFEAAKELSELQLRLLRESVLDHEYRLRETQ